MVGVIFSILGGMLLSIQSVFNTRVSEKVGLWETTAVVHAIGLAFALFIILFTGSEGFKKIGEVNSLYLFGGTFGVIIVFSIMKGVSSLGAAYAIAVLMIAQLLVATIIDSYGLFGMPSVKLGLTKILGILTMIIGIIIFNYHSGK